jgi:putative PEP-CTERM system histidine kinase
MDAIDTATIGYVASALASAGLLLLVALRWTRAPIVRAIVPIAVGGAAWSSMLAARSAGLPAAEIIAVAAEWVRYLALIGGQLIVLRLLDGERRPVRRSIGVAALVASVSLLFLTVYGLERLGSAAVAVQAASGIALSLVVIALAEQVMRSLSGDSRTGLAYVCVALFAIATYDIILFAGALMGGSIDPVLWAARGYVNALAVLPFVVFGERSAIRGEVDDSREAGAGAIFFPVVTAGVLVWLAGDEFIRRFGGSWMNVASIVLVVVTLSVAAALIVSPTIRSRARVFLTKTLFRYKYDYRKEWLRFIGTLSETGLERVPTTSVRAVAQIVNSPGGIVWTQVDDGDKYIPAGSWRVEMPLGLTLDADSSLVKFLRKSQWIVDLNEMDQYPTRYEGLELDEWFSGRDDLWLVVPMLLGKRLSGFIVLLKPRTVPTLNFEDHDLLRTVGRHAGTHIKQAELDKRLAESSQFGTYHRLSAFLMHDLNNLIAQQSLVVRNAEKYRHNPEFIDDTIDTIAHSVARMRRLMGQLSSVTKTPQSAKVGLRDVLKTAVEASSSRQPVPRLRFDGEELCVQADQDRLTVVIEHLVRNAQEATPQDGAIDITASTGDGMVTVEIRDSGAGMTPEFVSERLFRPFDSTKGSQSMGIGAYQAREYAKMLGGKLDVESEVGSGTTFSLRLPVAD